MKQNNKNNSLHVPSIRQKYDKFGNNSTFISSKTRIQDKELSDRNSKLHTLQVENWLPMTFTSGQKSVFGSSTELKNRFWSFSQVV